MVELARRMVLGGAVAGVLARVAPARALVVAVPDAAIIGWPSDIVGWDPNLRALPGAQPLYKLVFDQPLDLDPRLTLAASLFSQWELAPDAKSLTAELREDVRFHNGDRLTSADVHWTFLGRGRAGHKTDLATSWQHLVEIETPTDTRVILRFDAPAPTAPIRLADIGAFVVPKDYMEQAGPEKFAAKPIGTGPYKLVDAVPDGQIVLERNDAYWGPKPKLKRIDIDIIREPEARAAAVEAGRIDLTIDVPVRDVTRLATMPALAAELAPITRMILLQIRGDLGFADPDIRLAAHHAIDKAALSRAVYGGAAIPISVPATPGTPGYVDDEVFAHDPVLARQLLAKSGHGPQHPVRIRLGSTNGQFPGDIDLARAIMQMWQAVGIAAELEVIEYTKYAELNRANYLPEATLFSWDNPTGDPQQYAGILLNPQLSYSAWKDPALGQKMIDLSAVTDEQARLAGWRALDREATESGATIPLLQGVQSVVRKKTLGYTKYRNGWMLGQTMGWS
jgi:peptide/nickel transport system substrate-binding protein